MTFDIQTTVVKQTPSVLSELASWYRQVAIPAASLADNTADAERFTRVLQKELSDHPVEVPLALVRRLPATLRANQYRVGCTFIWNRCCWQVVAIDAPDHRPMGLAVDLGTTRIALRLIDLISGAQLAQSDLPNPQAAVGPDVITRIHYAARPEGLAHLSRLAVDAINTEANSLASAIDRQPDAIALAAIAGNTTMTHLLLAAEPRWIIREPYIPAINRPGIVPAADIGLALGPGARAIVFPNVGSYFGGDLIAGLICSQLHNRSETALMVDVGTNAEVIFGNDSWLIGCAGAAGPALESGLSRMGTTAGPGVIDRVRIDSAANRIVVHTIEDKPPVGICGSGVIDLAAALFSAGMVDIRGKLLAEPCGPLYRIHDEMAALEVVSAEMSGTGRPLTISQAEMDSLIRSKAAMYTILETLVTTVGMTLEQVDKFYVAGTFGAYIDPRSAITIGMIPDLAPEKFVVLGNSCLEGATAVLRSPDRLEEIDRIRDAITYLELNVNQDFMNRFSAAKFLPHTDIQRFPTVRLPSAL